jgi:predicted Zn finger-like uncharacterized protein
MLIVCPNCATSYQVEPSSLGATGRSVRCVRCQKVWFASNTDAMAAIALSHHQDIATFATAGDTVGEPRPAPVEPPHAPVESSTDQPPAEALDRDDRGPAPLPEPVDYQLPPEPATVDDAPPLAPADQEAPPQAVVENIPEDIESVAARRIRRPPPRPKSRWPMPGWGTAILLLITINIGLAAWRADIVRLLPQTASLYAAIGLEVNLRGLAFTELVTRRETQDGIQMLVVEGVVKSASKHPTNVPRLRFAVRNAKGHEIYNWTAVPEGNVIAPGATMPFRTRLASPPPEAQAVLVRFFNRHDLIAGVQ